MEYLRMALTKEEKIEYIQSRGFKVASENLAKGLKLKCSNGHIFGRTFDALKINVSNRCPECEKEEKVQYINSLGFEVVSEQLGSNLELKCPKGHIFRRTYSCITHATVCLECEKEEKVQYINSLGFEVVSEQLGSNLELKCPKGHIFRRTYGDLKEGATKCPECERKKRLQYINSFGFEVVSEQLGSNLELKCSKGHTFKRALGNLVGGATTCPECEKVETIQYINSLGFEVVSEQLGSNLELKCSKGHTFKRTFDSCKRGATKCPTCYPYSSSQELEIKEFLYSLGVEHQNSKWKVIDKFELDFYIPSANLAIEFDGIYWHSELQGKGSNYHLNKTELCLEKGISLLHIFENEWSDLTKREIWKSIIKGKLNQHQRIGARKCIIREVPKQEAYIFLDENHLQGRLGQKLALGLYFEDELVNLMTFGKNRMSSDVEWELLRFVSKRNVSVQGGASKLFKYFIHNYSEGKGVVSYSDRRYSQGNMYTKLGFTLKHNSKPNYFYFKNPLVLESRQKYMKHKLQNKLETFDPNLTEWENMKNNKYNRIWDCGNGVWVYHV